MGSLRIVWSRIATKLYLALGDVGASDPSVRRGGGLLLRAERRPEPPGAVGGGSRLPGRLGGLPGFPGDGACRERSSRGGPGWDPWAGPCGCGRVALPAGEVPLPPVGSAGAAVLEQALQYLKGADPRPCGAFGSTSGSDSMYLGRGQLPRS